jgi:predicted DNA-binding transcriptional regulator AlpA
MAAGAPLAGNAGITCLTCRVAPRRPAFHEAFCFCWSPEKIILTNGRIGCTWEQCFVIHSRKDLPMIDNTHQHQGVQPHKEAPKKARPKVRLPTPEALADVALIDATTCASAGSMGVSWWHEEVKAGRAPQPVIRESRCTRWKLSQVRQFWQDRADRGSANTETAELLRARATKASHKARAIRAAAAKAEG